MKKYMLFCFIIICFIKVNAQQTQSFQPTLMSILNTKTFVYVNKIRLDSLDAQYAMLSLKSLDNFMVFDYGESYDKWKTMILTNAGNIPYTFTDKTTPFILNLLYYNGWEVDQTLFSGTPNTSSQIVLRKRLK